MNFLTNSQENSFNFTTRNIFCMVQKQIKSLFSCFYSRTNAKSLYIGIKLENILLKKSNNYISETKQLLNQFRNAETHWIFSVHPEENESISLTINFTRNGKPHSYLSNPIFQNLQTGFVRIRQQLEESLMPINLYILNSDSLILKNKFHIQKIKISLNAICQKIFNLFIEIFALNHPAKYEKFQEKQNLIYHRKTVIEKQQTPTSIESIPNNYNKQNIRVLHNQLEKQNLQKDLDLSRRVAIRRLKISGKILVTGAQDVVEGKIDAQMYSREEKRFFFINQMQKSYLQHEIETLKKQKRILKHQNIGKFYLRRNKNMNEVQKEIYCEIYHYQFGQYAQKLLSCKNKAFSTLLRHLLQLISVLAFFYDHGLIHSDIKKENIMMEKREIRVIDIGGLIKCETIDNFSQDRVLFSTAGYYYQVKEEQEKIWNHKKFDMFGLGKIIQELFLNRKIAQSVEGTKYEQFQPYLKEIETECKKHPSSIEIDYKDIFFKLGSLGSM